MTRILKLILGYSLIVSALCYAFYSGKKQGHLICVDFNVLPLIQNLITITVCLTLVVLGIKLITTK